MTEQEALIEAIIILGGQSETASKLSKAMGIKITQSHVCNWIRRSKRLPEKYAMHVQALTKKHGKMIPASALCPLSFPKTIKAA